MRMKGLIVVLALAALSGCATQSASRIAAQDVSPMEAIQRSASAAPQGVAGVFVMEVKGTGEDRGSGYLNSEADYRDQRCLTIQLRPAAYEQLRQTHGEAALSFYANKRIRVRGEAVRTRIDFTVGGRRTGKYYYQTQVPVTDLAQITVIGEG